MEFWKMNGAGNDFIIIQKLKLFKKFKITVDKQSVLRYNFIVTF